MVVELMQTFETRRLAMQRVAGGDRRDDSSDSRRERAQRAIQTLMALGFSEGHIAHLADLNPASISHILDPYGCRAVGRETVARLTSLVRTAGAERLDALLPRLPIRVLDTDCQKGFQLDDVSRALVAEDVRHLLRSALLASACSVRRVPEVGAFIARIGEGDRMYLLGDMGQPADEAKGRLAQLHRLEHEVEHLRQRLREERAELEHVLNGESHSEPPIGGRIA
jgi:hypothetical protein